MQKSPDQRKMRIALAQLRMKIGTAFDGIAPIEDACHKAIANGCSLIAFPEMTLTGYSPRDLLWDQNLVEECEKALEHLLPLSHKIAILVGHPSVRNATANGAGSMVIAATLLHQGQRCWQIHKKKLASGSVFDDARYFVSSQKDNQIQIDNVRITVFICEDAWHESCWQHSVHADTDFVLAINASPYTTQAFSKRLKRLSALVRQHQKPFAYLNWVGSDDTILYDGNSMVLDALGKLSVRLPQFKEALAYVDFDWARFEGEMISSDYPVYQSQEISDIDQALCMGIYDYWSLNNLGKAVIGLSGGIDSAVCLVLLVRALGAENILAVLLPSPYTAAMSNEDASALSDALGVDRECLDISQGIKWVDQTLTHRMTLSGLAAENVQPRLRCLLLMAIANQLGGALVNTTNKSEAAVGYGTLYGDLSGAVAPLMDLSKERVFELARYYIGIGFAIPKRILEREPSAELRENQKDQDTLPEYPLIDAVVSGYLEEGMTIKQIAKKGYDLDMVRRIVEMIHQSEFKRNQAPPAIRVTERSFGRDWRMPLTMPRTF